MAGQQTDSHTSVDCRSSQSIINLWPELHWVGVEGGRDVVHHCDLNKFFSTVNGLDDCCYINLTTRWTKRRGRGAEKDLRKRRQGERGVSIIRSRQLRGPRGGKGRGTSQGPVYCPDFLHVCSQARAVCYQHTNFFHLMLKYRTLKARAIFFM